MRKKAITDIEINKEIITKTIFRDPMDNLENVVNQLLRLTRHKIVKENIEAIGNITYTLNDRKDILKVCIEIKKKA